MDVVGPSERDQDVHVEKPNQASSRAAWTISGVMGLALSLTWNTGKRVS
jgi:hypothetical protein